MRNEDKIAYLEKWKDFYRNYGGNHTVDIENLDSWIEEVRRNETAVKEEPKQVYYSPIPSKFHLTEPINGWFWDTDIHRQIEYTLVAINIDSENENPFVSPVDEGYSNFKFPAYGPDNLPPVGIPYLSEAGMYIWSDVNSKQILEDSRCWDVIQFHGFPEAWVTLVEEES